MNISEPDKRKLRKIHAISPSVKVIIYEGLHGGPLVASQFHTDVRVYGLYEALLYVESYEPKHYHPGTAQKVVDWLTNV